MTEPGTVLVVDDLPQNVRLLEAVLRPRGYGVRAAASGAEALAACEAEPPDLVVLDVVMPVMDGYEVCRRLRRNPATQALPVLMITASGDQDRIAGLEAGADDFVAKPFDQAELLARVRSLLRMKEYQDTIRAQAADLASLNSDLEARVREQVEQLARLGRLRRFLAPALADLLVSTGDESILESHREEIAVLHCELRDFTAFAEAAAPEEVMAVLAEFHEAAGAVAHRAGATVGPLTGPGLIAYLNDPLPCPEPAWQAVSLAVAMRDAVSAFTAAWRRRGHALHLGLGVALGYATIGRMGFDGRWDYGPVGPVVDLATRLGAQAADGQILMSQRARAAVEGRVQVEALGPLALEGFREPVTAFAVTALQGSPPQSGLSARELEVLALIVEGASNRGIADRLVISEKTAIRHVSNIFVKLGVHTRAQATRVAIERGLVEIAEDRAGGA
jgi:DNA-binding NarL/FixJ family response regulator